MLQGSSDSSVVHWPVADVGLLHRSVKPTRALKLAEVGEALPDFVASAIISRHWERPAEAVLFSWIVAELLINRAWKDRIDEVAISGSHRGRLQDTRSYTASVQIDSLHGLGRVSDEASRSLHQARGRRNALAHSAKLDNAAADECITAMGIAMVELGGVTLDQEVGHWQQLGSMGSPPATGGTASQAGTV